MSGARDSKLQFGERPLRVWRIVLGGILILWSIGGLVRPVGSLAAQGGLAGGLGTMLGLGTLVALGIGGFWLLRSGLPKSSGSR
jgi:hypothetical protein